MEVNRVEMTVTNKRVGYSFLRSCGDDSDQALYIVPTYLMTVGWMGQDGKWHVCLFEVIRFGISYSPEEGTHIDEKYKNARGYIRIQNWTDYPTRYPFDDPGAWQIEGQYLLHDGPDNPRWFRPEEQEFFAICSLGCILVCGPGEWSRLNNTIKEAAGVPNWGYAAGPEGNLWIKFNQVTDEEFPEKLYKIENWRDDENQVNFDTVLPKLREFLIDTYGKEPSDFYGSCREFPIPDRRPWSGAARTGPLHRVDPLLLDLDGDGITTTRLTNWGRWFDHDANGFAEATAWVGPDDGLLVMDRNGNGIIDDGSELFGNSTILSDGKKASNGFQALAAFDGNGDGKIDAADSIFSHLLVWQDWDSNGYSSEYELYGLDDLGIASIDIHSTATQITDEQGNIQNRLGSFEWVDGTTGQVGEYTFQRDTMFTIPTDPPEVPADIAALPDLHGYGNVYDLQQAMARDASGQLVSLVNQFIAATDVSDRNSLMDRILFQWTGSENIDPASRGKFIDARKLGVLEKIFGESFVGVAGPNPTESGAALLQQSYLKLFETMYSQLMEQSHLKDLFDMVWCGRCEETNGIGPDMSVVIYEFNNRLAADPEQGRFLLSEFARSVRGLQLLDTGEYLAFREEFIDQDPSLGWGFDTGGLPVFDAPHQGTRWWVTTEIEGTDGSEAVKGSLTLGGGWLNSLNGNDVIYGTDRNESLTNEIGNAILVAGGGDDRIWAGAGDDILDGGAGIDTLYGGTGNDTYMFRRGSEQDTIVDTDATPGNVDTIWLGSNLTPEEIVLRRAGSNLVLSIIGTSDTLTVKDFFRNDGILNRVERIQFMDGTLWNDSDMIAKAYAPSEDDDIIYGGSESDDLRGLGGRDRIYGMDGDDVLRGDEASDWLYGGAGNDILDGGEDDDIVDGGVGDDTYRFGRGSGHDRIIFSTAAPGDTDTISLGDDVLPADIRLQRTGDYILLDDVLLTVADTGDSIELLKWIGNDAPVSGLQIAFADGMVWDTDGILDVLVTGTEGDDTIYGFTRADVMIGGDGNDTIYGHGGDDTLEAGMGDDQLFGEAGNDTLRGGAGKDTLIGGLGDDVFDGGADADTLYGEKGVYVYHSYYSPGTGNGNDTYLFGREYGQDTVIDHDKTPGNTDTIRFLDDLTPDDIIVRRNKSDLELTVNGTTDKLTVYNWFWCDSDEYKVERIEFSDGTVWDVDTMRQMTLRGSDGDDTLIGYSDSDSITGYGGDDTLYGRDGADLLDGGAGDDSLFGESDSDTLLGGDGNDTLAGGTGHDVLNGGIGNDILYGGHRNDWYYTHISNGNDTYVFERGSGQDTVVDYDAAPANLDTILLDGDLQPEDVNLKRTGENLVLSINGTTDTLTVSNWFKDEAGAYQVERIQFADGTTWNADAIRQMLLQGTDGDDILIGYSTGDTIMGFGAQDRLYGREGDDTLNGGAGDDILAGEAGNDTLLGGEGDDDLWAGAGDDILDGGAGTDYLNGGIGNDTYLFDRNSGRDMIVDTDRAPRIPVFDR